MSTSSTTEPASRVAWAQIRLPVAHEQHQALRALVERTHVTAGQHMRLAVLQHLETQHWGPETAARLQSARPADAQLAFALPRELKARLRALANSTGLPLSNHLRLALAFYLEQAEQVVSAQESSGN